MLISNNIAKWKAILRLPNNKLAKLKGTLIQKYDQLRVRIGTKIALKSVKVTNMQKYYRFIKSHLFSYHLRLFIVNCNSFAITLPNICTPNLNIRTLIFAKIQDLGEASKKKTVFFFRKTPKFWAPPPLSSIRNGRVFSDKEILELVFFFWCLP